MSEREKFWIKELNTYIKDKDAWGYNMTRGGECLFGEDNPFYGKHHTEETKIKISELSKQRTKDKNHFYGRHHTEETKQKISKANSGRKYSEEQKQKMNRSEKQSGEGNPFYGKHHTKEARQKISEARKGIVPSTAIKWEAYNDKETIYFASNGKIMEWLIKNNYIKQDEHFTTSMLKNNLKKSEIKHIEFMGYYWKKSVETIESTDIKNDQEVSRVDVETDTTSKCEDIALAV